MKKAHHRTVFVCQQCGKESPKWLGQCPNCKEWNSLVETAVAASQTWLTTSSSQPQELARVTLKGVPRLVLPLAEFNRVLGGGLVPGSLVLVGGDPGIGKSTLLLQVSALAAQGGSKVVYVSGEESLHQIKLRAERLGLKGQGIFLLAETNLELIPQQVDKISPQLAVVDSIQTVYLPEVAAAPGSVSQIRECTLKLMRWAKESAVPILLTGHVTKDGAIAGPRALEHIVDVVLYLEGELFSTYRLLRSIKNRFGSTNEIGIFRMTGEGLREVDNPSQVFLSQHQGEVVGSVAVATLEGSRPLLVEIQALTTPTSFGPPRRVANGIDFGRLLLITAVLTKRVGLNLSSQDVMVNVTGGLKIAEPSADLGIAISIASSFRDATVEPDLAVVGEIGLSGELRPVPQLERRVTEAARLGFKRCLTPRISSPQGFAAKDMELREVNTVGEALPIALRGRRRKGELNSPGGKAPLEGQRGSVPF